MTVVVEPADDLYSIVGAALLGVLDCAYQGLTTKPATALLAPGTEAVLDECCDGMLWVRLVSLAPVYDRNRCMTYQTADVEVGLVRCVSTIDDAGNAPSPEQQTWETLQMVKDMQELRNSLLCCVPEVKRVLGSSLNQWAPQGPEGGCAGGTWSLTLRFAACGCP